MPWPCGSAHNIGAALTSSQLQLGSCCLLGNLHTVEDQGELQQPGAADLLPLVAQLFHLIVKLGVRGRDRQDPEPLLMFCSMFCSRANENVRMTQR